ncbi:NADH:flavin oxidoreductase/NADH oxidase [Bradyrhizobium sp. CCGUVB1N3]|uniref:NADH:flavin oxidoreductase/NADH oxidase n=1 Tax=Bradyrhizobium sp. CCGUVB1N3 TaxID=2949629 RepID=UPI0020B1C034|nr:NADH:flavin oxidoreductase/NADH oxidase [Bradyrhizobium sp. CCGUVB1N3]MCP3468810.1 NADH:flavin oxidoreductase/NADH oxidase [Bradyrhizobium sp. CCGUVB1N3]
MSALFSPGRIGGLDLDNRIVVSPMCQYSAVNGVAQSWHLIHIGNLVLSGAGLVIMEATAVEAVGRGTHGCLGLYTDAQEAALAALVANVRGLSRARLGLQLTHCGRKASTRTIPERWRGEPLPPEEGAWTPVAPSALPFDAGWAIPDELDDEGIDRLIGMFAASAERASRAGFDLIEIHGAHGYLVHNFFSPIANRRTDQWGGSIENRIRFPVEIARAVRRVWPKERALGFRINSTDWHPDGVTLEDAVLLAQGLEREGVDYVAMSAGNIAPGIAIPPASPGHQVPFATEIKQRTGLTAMAVGMIARPDQAEAIVAEDRADFVALARPMLDNPRWGLHAAAVLGVDIDYAPQYIRARPNNWLGFTYVHPDTRPPATTRQLDRPRSATWDRPKIG